VIRDVALRQESGRGGGREEGGVDHYTIPSWCDCYNNVIMEGREMVGGRGEGREGRGGWCANL
jgi:hypothetical protein